MAGLGAAASIAITVALFGMAVAGIIAFYGLRTRWPSELLTVSAVAAGLVDGVHRQFAVFVGPYAAGWISQRTGSLLNGDGGGSISSFSYRRC